MLDTLDAAGAVSTTGGEHAPLGQVLLERGLLSEPQLRNALEEQERTGFPLGQVLIGLGYVTASTIAQALATQHGGLLKTEYGFATGFASEPSAEPVGAPPVSPAQAPALPGDAVPPLATPGPELGAAGRIAELEREVAAARDAAARVELLELEVASARQAEQVARGSEQVARMELAAARASGQESGAAAARIAELETAHDEMKRQLGASMERSEQLERALADLRSGAAGELQRTQHELAVATESLRAAYARLHEYEAAAFQQQRAAQLGQQRAETTRSASPFAWRS